MVSHHFSERYLMCFNYEPAFLKVKDLPPNPRCNWNTARKPMGLRASCPVGQSQERRPHSSIMRVFEQQMFFFWMFLSFREVGPTCTFQECWKVGRTEIVKLVKVHCISSLEFEGLEVFKSLATGINFVWTLQGVPNAWCSHSPVDLIDS